MIEYWHWHTLHYGTETYWGGVLPHSQQPGRVYREVTELGRRLARLGPLLEGYEPDAEVAILWSTDSRFAFEYQPPLADETGTPDGLSYRRIFEASYRGILDAGARARVLHVGQAVQLGGAGCTLVPGAGGAGRLRRHRRPAAASRGLRRGGRPPDRRHPNRLRRRGGAPGSPSLPTC